MWRLEEQSHRGEAFKHAELKQMECQAADFISIGLNQVKCNENREETWQLSSMKECSANGACMATSKTTTNHVTDYSNRNTGFHRCII